MKIFKCGIGLKYKKNYIKNGGKCLKNAIFRKRKLAQNENMLAAKNFKIEPEGEFLQIIHQIFWSEASDCPSERQNAYLYFIS